MRAALKVGSKTQEGYPGSRAGMDRIPIPMPVTPMAVSVNSARGYGPPVPRSNEPEVLGVLAFRIWRHLPLQLELTQGPAGLRARMPSQRGPILPTPHVQHHACGARVCVCEYTPNSQWCCSSPSHE